MRIFYTFLVVCLTVILFLLPLTESVYDFRTDLETDTFDVTTAVGVTSANTTLSNPIYDDDTDTISYISDEDEAPIYSAYNTSTRLLTTANLTANTTRELQISYDVDALEGGDGINNLLGRVAWIWLLLCIAFPAAALAAIWTNRA